MFESKMQKMKSDKNLNLNSSGEAIQVQSYLSFNIFSAKVAGSITKVASYLTDKRLTFLEQCS